VYSSPNIIRDEVREYEMGMACSMHGEGRRRMHTDWWKIQKEGDH
jgi:hypothetical protein